MIKKYINLNNLNKSLNKYQIQKPFPYTIVDNFFKKNVAKKLEKEFLKYNNQRLHEYKNYCEVKKSSNNWNLFPPITYQIFTYLNSSEMTDLISKKLNISKIYPDYGLNGGGWHMMNNKGRLNPHLDYFIHPKINAQRKFNLIVFLTKNWKKNFGGEVCFYSKNINNNKMPGKIEKKIYPKFNRAVFFDTSKTSWHSVEPIKTKKIRKSIAIYYLIPIKKNNLIQRKKAMYSPIKSQIDNKKVLKFIKLRASSKLYTKVYKTK